MMLKSGEVGTAGLRRKPARANNRRYSSTVRSFPPVMSSIATSANFTADGAFPSGRTHPTNKTTPSAGTARRQLARIIWARSSSQSWMTCFTTYARQPEGTSRKKSQSRMVLRDTSSPPRKPRSLARSGTSGRPTRYRYGPILNISNVASNRGAEKSA